MKLTLLSISLLLFLSSILQAQNQSTPDTLDWRRYFPLEIGNEWQYRRNSETLGRDIFDRWKIESDTLIGDRKYLVLERTLFNDDFQTRTSQRHYLRHDSTRASVVYAFRLPNDEFSEYDWSFLPCGLDADFNSENICRNELETSFYVSGNYGRTVSIGGQPIQVEAIKIYSSLGRVLTMVSDVGLIELGPDGSFPESLEYAKIRGVVYGMHLVTDSNEFFPSNKELTLSVYSSPFSRNTNISFNLSRSQKVDLLVYDLMGRQVHDDYLGHKSRGEHRINMDLSALSMGTYFIQLKTDEGRREVIPIVKVL